MASVFFALAAMAAIALASVVVVSRDLKAVYRLEAQLRSAQHRADDTLRLQIDEETAIRGFAATKRRVFLEPYFGSEPLYANALAELGRTLADAGVVGAVPHVAAIGALHARWLQEVAAPWLAAGTPESVDVGREIRGKTYVDRIRVQSNYIVREIERRATSAQDEANERFSQVGIATLVAILVIGVAGILAAVRQRRLEESLSRQRSIVETLQSAFINRWDTLESVSIGTAYVSATSHAAVGGDLFDIRRLDQRRGYVLIADVSGKGIEAAVDTAFIKYSIRALVRQFSTPEAVLGAFNDLYAEARSSKDSFVVVFLGILDTERLTLRYASAGHPAAWLRRGGDVRSLAVTGPLLGVFEAPSFGVEELQLQADDLLVLATDGLTEARRPGGEMLTEEGAAVWIAETSDAEPQRFIDDLALRLRRYVAGPVRDDLAMLALKVVSAPLPPPAPALGRGPAELRRAGA